MDDDGTSISLKMSCSVKIDIIGPLMILIYDERSGLTQRFVTPPMKEMHFSCCVCVLFPGV